MSADVEFYNHTVFSSVFYKSSCKEMPIISMLEEGLTDLVKDEVAMLWGVKGEIERLQNKFQTIKTAHAHAQNKKIENDDTAEWLRKLEDVMYDADDILDECRIEAEKSKAALIFSSCCSFWTSLCLFFCSCFGKTAFAHQIGRRIQDLNHRLEDLWEEGSNLNLLRSSANRDDHRSTSRVSKKTSSIPEPDIVGSNIKNDTKKLVELLNKEDTRENILVYSIVGTSGIGKTTIARSIFNDEKIKANFLEPMRFWVCVSKDFEETSLLKDIITQAGKNPGGASSRALLEPMVQNAVTKKKFFLVLDDSWDQNVWNDLLRNPLQSGATGSRVLVTTRNEGVASQMKAVEPHHKVEALSTDDGWALLCKKVVLSGQEREIEDLKDIGKEIVDKCGGLPLAIKTIGGVLSTKSRTKKDWENVLGILSNNPWSSWTNFPKEVQPALYLSYEDLPSHLKQCFLYCSLFPEDYRFYRRELIQFWISEGFIQEEGGLTLEELGEYYYGELVQRSFLQPYPWYDDDDPRCTVHDLLWSLARLLAGDENLVVKDGVLERSYSVKPRRMKCIGVTEKCQEFINALEGHNSLRTLLSLVSKVEENDVDNLIKKIPRLRILGLGILRPSLSEIMNLPGSLGNLVHLRWLELDLTYSRITLPENIGNLVNLQFLILRSCIHLRSLPKGIGKLHNLRCLDLGGTLEGIPIEIANCNRLTTLRNFVVRNNSSDSGWCTLEQLRYLEKLRVLTICHLERALNEGEVGKVYALRNMLQLEVLKVECDIINREEEIKRIEEIFEVTLCPPSPSHLESLRIEGFCGRHYPSWIASSSTDSLRQLVLWLWIRCQQLPPLGKLPNLDYLYITGARAIKKIGTEFLGQEPDCSRDRGQKQISFPKLTKLIFSDMPIWEEWEWEVKDDDKLIALPNLKELTLEQCPQLRSLPSGLVRHATALTKLVISHCDSLKAIRGFSSVKELVILRCHNLEGASDLLSLKTLTLDDREIEVTDVIRRSFKLVQD